MPIAISKSDGTWHTPAVGDVAILLGSMPTAHQSFVDWTPKPTNWWPIRDDPVGTVCDDKYGTKDGVYSGNIAAGHPTANVPFSSALRHHVVIPGGVPFKGKADKIVGFECMFKTVNSGGLFGYQQNAAYVSGALGPLPAGYVPMLYVGTDGLIRGTLYPSGVLQGPFVADGVWHHVALLTSGATKRMYLYVDGVQVAYNANGAGFTTSGQVWLNHAQIGVICGSPTWPGSTHAAGAAWVFFNGEIRNFAYWGSGTMPSAAFDTRGDYRPRWYVPPSVKIKIGAAGGGSWLNSGLVGAPGNMAIPTVYGWISTEAAVRIQWIAPTTGAPAVAYQARSLSETGTVLFTSPEIKGVMNGTNGAVGYLSTNGMDFRFGGNGGGNALARMTKYQFQVRAKSSGGVWSPWSGSLKVSIGKPEEAYTFSEYRTRPWSASRANSAVAMDGMVYVNVPSNVSTTSIRFVLDLHNGSTPLFSANRKGHWLVNGVDWGDSAAELGTVAAPWDYSKAWSVGSPGANGLILRGSGWWHPNGWSIFGTVYMWGTETYLFQETRYHPEVPNGYW